MIRNLCLHAQWPKSLTIGKNFGACTVESLEELELAYNRLQSNEAKMKALEKVYNHKELQKMVQEESLNTSQSKFVKPKSASSVKGGRGDVFKELWKDCLKLARKIYNKEKRKKQKWKSAGRVNAGKKKVAYLKHWHECVKAASENLACAGVPKKGTEFYAECKRLMNDQ